MTENAENLPELIDVIDEPIPIAKIIELRNRKLSYAEISKLLDCTPQNIEQRLRPFRQSIANLQSVKDNRADTLAVVSDTLLNSLGTDSIKKMSGLQKITGFGILYDKERLERGQTSVNVGYADFSKDVKELDAEIQALDAELGEGAPGDQDDTVQG